MAPVFFMTTIHGIRWDRFPHFPVHMRLRRRPKETSSAPANVIHNFDIPVTKQQAKMFLEHHFESTDIQLAIKEFKKKAIQVHTGRMMQPVDEVADFYNHNMNGCDVADQFRAYLVCQLCTLKSWQPLAFFLVDQSLINAFLLWRWKREQDGIPIWKSKRRAFVQAVVASLLEGAPYVTRYLRVCSGHLSFRPRTDITPARFHRSVSLGWRVAARTCYWRRVQGKPQKQQRRVRRICCACNLVLCNDCFGPYHKS